MKQKILYGILIGLGSIVLLFMAFPFGLIFALAFWIYLGVQFSTRKGVFYKEMSSETFEKKSKTLKKLFIAAGILFIIAVIGVVMHNAQSGLSETEESFYFFVGIGSSYVFILISVISAVIFLKAKQKPL